MLAVGLAPLVVSFVDVIAAPGSLLQPLARSPLTGAACGASDGRTPSALLAASDGPFEAFTVLLAVYALPAELALVGSSVPDVAEAFTSSFVTYAAGSTLSRGAELPGWTVLLVIQSSMFDIKLIIVSIRSDQHAHRSLSLTHSTVRSAQPHIINQNMSNARMIKEIN